MKIADREPNDIRWQCRRGMLELDILLNDFVDAHLMQLSEQQNTTLRRLLGYPDQVLLDLLLGNTVSSDREIADIISLINGARSY